MGRYLKDGVGELRSGYFSDECRDRNVDGVGGVGGVGRRIGGGWVDTSKIE